MPPSTLTDLKESLDATNALLTQLLVQGSQNQKLLQELTTLIRGHTADGTSFTAHRTDPFVVMYAALLAPVVAQMVKPAQPNVAEMAKAFAPLARELLLELDAYRSQTETTDYIQSQLELIDHQS